MALSTTARSLGPLLIAVALLGGCDDDRPPVAVGTLERDRIELIAERREPILQLSVREGDSVEVGDVLVRLDRRRIDAEMEQATASRDLSRARFAELFRGTRPEEIKEAQAQMAEAEADLAVKKLELDRVRNLASDKIATLSDLDSAVAANAGAQARLAASRAALERLLNGATTEQLDQQRADLARSEAVVARLAIDLERMTVIAPRAGVVDTLPFKVGDEPAAGAVVAVLLTGTSPFARVYVPGALRPSAKAGASASVQVEGYETPFEGRLRWISAEAAFTPYFALTERDRGHLAYLAEIDLIGEAAGDLPTGVPVEVSF